MKASDFVALYLEARGVTHSFELVGGMITHLLDSLSRTQIQLISCHHEQGAGFAAEGMARVSGVPGIALATSGPGATNLITAIGSCYFDSTPAIFITGQVNTYELRGNTGARQLGFQETDIVAIATPICKSAVQVQHATDLPELLHKAFNQALDGRQGPCLVDIPMNVQAETIEEALAFRYLKAARKAAEVTFTEIQDINSPSLKSKLYQLLKTLRQAQKPLLLMGGGCAAQRNRTASLKLARQLDIPVVLSLMGVDLLPTSDTQRVGFIGSYGNRWANKLLGAADVLVVIGSRLDIRQTGSDVASFCADKQIWQIEIDAAEIGLRVQPQETLQADVIEVQQALQQLLQDQPDLSLPTGIHDSWYRQIIELRLRYPAELEYQAKSNDINPINALQQLSSRNQGQKIYVTDVGQHQMWAAQSLQFQSEDRWLTSGGMGAMGFGLPAAIGAALARPDLSTVLISGDGSFQLNLQELETVRRNNLNLKILLFNNHCHGMVRQFQESYFKDNLQSTVKGYSAPNFTALAQAYGIKAWSASDQASANIAIEQWIETDGPTLLELHLSQASKVYPKLAFGRRFGEMEPDITPIAMEST